MNTPPPKNPTGPEPLRVKIEGTFDEAAKRVLGKPKPPEGWPGTPQANKKSAGRKPRKMR